MKNLIGVGRSWVIVGVAIASFHLTGCSVEKARALQGAALQFRNESLSAIDAIDTMRRRELEAPPRSQEEIRQQFVSRILNSQARLDSRVIDLAIDPFQPPKVAEWDDFIQELRNQYEGFSEIFEKIDNRATVSRDEVRKSGEYARTLTVQMALLADALSKNPPVLTQYRTSVISRLQRLRKDYQTVVASLNAGSGVSQQLSQRKLEMESQAGQLLDEWQQIKQEEQKLLETTVAQCMRAVTVGKEVIEVADRFDQVELAQLNALVPRVLDVASAFTGKDYSVVRSRASRIVAEIRSDPLWRNVAQRFLDRANAAAARRTQPQLSQADPFSSTSR